MYYGSIFDLTVQYNINSKEIIMKAKKFKKGQTTDYTTGYNEGWDNVIENILFELSQGDAPESKESIIDYIKTLIIK